MKLFATVAPEPVGRDRRARRVISDSQRARRSRPTQRVLSALALAAFLTALVDISLSDISFAAPVEIASSLTLDQAVNTALRNNAQLQAMHARWEALRSRPAQATALPNPRLTWQGGNSPDQFEFPKTQETRVRLEQEFLWPGKLGLKGQIAAQDATAMLHEYETTARDVALLVKETYFDLYGVQQSRTLTRTDQLTLADILKLTENLYTTGQRPQSDVIKAQSELTILQQKLLEYDQQEATLRAKLALLLNVDTLPSIAVTAPTDQVRAAGPPRPEIQRAETELQRSRSERALMKKEFFPDYRLGVEYGHMDSGFADFSSAADVVMLSISFDLPIWHTKYRAGVREADDNIDAAQATLESTRRQVAFEVQDATFKLQTARQTLALYRNELLPQAEARFKASEAAYRSGQGGFLDLLESERFRLNARVLAATAEANLGTQAARLERATGAGEIK